MGIPSVLDVNSSHDGVVVKTTGPGSMVVRALLFKWAPMNSVEVNPAVHGAAVVPVAVAPTTACSLVEAWRKQGRLTISRSAGGVLRPSLGLQARE